MKKLYHKSQHDSMVLLVVKNTKFLSSFTSSYNCTLKDLNENYRARTLVMLPIFTLLPSKE